MTDEEKKLNEAIKQDGIEKQSEILEELKRRYPQYVESSHNEQETVTDAQIEKAEKSLKWVVNQIPDNLGDSNEEKMLKCIKRYCESGAEAIDRLKRDKERIKKNWRIAVSVQRAKWKAKVKHAGKDTAQEILQDWYDDTKVRLHEDGSYIINYAKRYGVELDE